MLVHSLSLVQKLFFLLTCASREVACSHLCSLYFVLITSVSLGMAPLPLPFCTQAAAGKTSLLGGGEDSAPVSFPSPPPSVLSQLLQFLPGRAPSCPLPLAQMPAPFMKLQAEQQRAVSAAFLFTAALAALLAPLAAPGDAAPTCLFLP